MPELRLTLSPISLKIRAENEISLYKGELTPKVTAECCVKIKKAFPDLPADFFEILQEMIKSEEFSDQCFRDSVTYVIKTCVYPKPTIAQFISWDRVFKIHTYLEYCKLVSEGDNGENYKPIKFKDKEIKVWVHVNDIKRYNLKDYDGTK